jgi:hypothetical protein
MDQAVTNPFGRSESRLDFFRKNLIQPKMTPKNIIDGMTMLKALASHPAAENKLMILFSIVKINVNSPLMPHATLAIIGILAPCEAF